VGDVRCVCGRLAIHEAAVGARWIAYCCVCFDHDWPGQRLVPGRECQRELVEVPVTTVRREWRWKEGSGG